ncbi:MAG: hypothetical protein JWP38_2470 [Herbaspirillum sp.]|nr:hypothetical protein [Herbaspirillum sp.]
MTKGKVSHATIVSRASIKRTDDANLQAFRALALELKSNPAERREIVMKAGIVTATGQLKKAYRQK